MPEMLLFVALKKSLDVVSKLLLYKTRQLLASSSQIQDQSMSVMDSRWKNKITEKDRSSCKHGKNTAHKGGDGHSEIEHDDLEMRWSEKKANR